MQQSCSIFHILLVIFVMFVIYKLFEHLLRTESRLNDIKHAKIVKPKYSSVILIEPSDDSSNNTINTNNTKNGTGRPSYGNGKNPRNVPTFEVSDMIPYNGYSTTCNFDQNEDNEHMETVSNNNNVGPVIPPQIMTEIMGSPNDLEIMSANGGNNTEGNFFELADANAYPYILSQRPPYTTKYDDILTDDTNKVTISSSNANTKNLTTNKLSVGSNQSYESCSPYMKCDNNNIAENINYNDEPNVLFAQASSDTMNSSYGSGKL